MGNKLNQLLANAKQENPLLTQTEVSNLINNSNLLGKKQSFFTLKNILIMLLILIITSSLWLFLSNNQLTEKQILQVNNLPIQTVIAKENKTTQMPNIEKVILNKKTNKHYIHFLAKLTRETKNQAVSQLFSSNFEVPNFAPSQTNDDSREHF
jgi:hypothetical protein